MVGTDCKLRPLSRYGDSGQNQELEMLRLEKINKNITPQLSKNLGCIQTNTSINAFHFGYRYTDAWVNSEDPDEMLHKAAFH